MFVLNLLNNLIYNALKNSDNEFIKNIENIYTSLPKEPIFPYIFIESGNIKKCNNYQENIYEVDVSIKIYNKNKSSTDVLNIVNSVQNVVENIEHNNILDINILKISNNFNNSLFPYFESIVNVCFLVLGS